VLGSQIVLLGLLFPRSLLRLMDSGTHGLAEVTEPLILGGFFAGMGGRRRRTRDSTSESLASMTLAVAVSLLAPATLRSIPPTMATATVAGSTAAGAAPSTPATMAAAAPATVVTTTACTTTMVTAAATTCTPSAAASTAASPTTLFRVGDTVIDVAKWHLKISQERDDQHGKDRCHQALNYLPHGLIPPH
jgi:hypothetical protein